MIIGKKQLDDLKADKVFESLKIVEEIEARKLENSNVVFDSYRTQVYVKPYKEFAPEMKKVKPIEKPRYVMPKFTPYVAPIRELENIVDEKGEKEERSL